MRKTINLLAAMNVLGAGMGGIYMGMTLEPEYYLTVIADEQTPLAAAPLQAADTYYPWTIAIMLLLAAVAGVVWYIGKCMKYRSYYYDMLRMEMTKETPDIGWNLARLKRMIHEKENKLVEQMIAQE